MILDGDFTPEEFDKARRMEERFDASKPKAGDTWRERALALKTERDAYLQRVDEVNVERQRQEVRAIQAENRVAELAMMCHQYEALCKSLERILWGNDMGRSRDEIEERVAALTAVASEGPGGNP